MGLGGSYRVIRTKEINFHALSTSYNTSKIIFDYLFSFVSIVLLFPLLILIFILIWIDSGSPSIYLGKRVGKGGANFNIIKFRTMIIDAEKHLGGNVTSKNDLRITKIGKLLRKYKLDELTQLFNILKGDMSFVGPRPEVQEYVNLYSQEDREIILSVKPGITDLSSLEFIQLGEELGLNSERQFKQRLDKILEKKIQLRRKYIEDMSFSLDLKIIFKTFFKILG